MGNSSPIENAILSIDNKDKNSDNQDKIRILISMKIKGDNISELALYNQLGIQENKVSAKAKEEIKGKVGGLRDGDNLKLLSNFDIVIERDGVEANFASLGNSETQLISELLNSKEIRKEERKSLVESLSIENKVRYYILFSGNTELANIISNSNQKDLYSIFGIVRRLGLEKAENYALVRKSFTNESNGGYEINFYGNKVLQKYITAGDLFGDQKKLYIGNDSYTQKSDGTFRNKNGKKLRISDGQIISFLKGEAVEKTEKEKTVQKEKKTKNTPKPNEKIDTGKETVNQDEKMKSIIDSLSKENSLNIDPELVKSLIIRESGGKIDAKSHTGSRGIMQLTGSVFADMKMGGGGRWDNYIEYFAKIPPDVINLIGDKNAKSKQAMLRIVEIARSKNVPDKKEYNLLMNQAKRGIYDPALNMIMGCIYLTYQKEHGTERTVKKLNSKILNSLIAGKGITSGVKETQEYLVKLKKLLKTDPEIQAEYDACVNYNADKTPERDGIGHMHYFGAAIIITKLARADKKKQVS